MNYIQTLYISLLNAWNDQSAAGFSELFFEDGNVIGYDGTPLNGKKAIFEELDRIFSHHPTAKFVYKIREVREISEDTVLLRSVVGMVPRKSLTLIETAEHDCSEKRWRMENCVVPEYSCWIS